MVNIVWFENLTKNDIPIAGGKGANLGEMLSAGLPVPPGFIISAETFKSFIEGSGINEDIDEILKETDVNDTQKLTKASEMIGKMITGTRMPDDVKADLLEAYKKLSEGAMVIAGIGEGEQGEYVAVRSSATAEDLPDASFAGQQATFLNVQGQEALVKAVQKCWASLYTPRAIFYRVQKGFEHSKVFISVIVQKMVDSEKSGVMFTIDPITNDKSKISIEAVWGLGEAIVGGEVTPDNYEVGKEALDVLDKRISEKVFLYTRDITSGKTVKQDLKDDMAKKQVLTDEEIVKMAELGKKIEEHYKFPQDVEWAVEDGIIYIVQSRPVTTIKEKEGETEEIDTEGKEILVKGLIASPGVGAGKVKIVHDMSELSKVEKGDVLVTEMTTPDMVPAMQRAVAIVTNSGGSTCHAAIVSRELGIACIVGTTNGTDILKEEQEVTVDANKGIVIAGLLAGAGKKEVEFEIPTDVPETKTKIYVNLGVPSMAEKVAKLPVDGVGLMREEFIFASMIGEHPLAMIEHGEQQKFIDKLAEGIATVARAFSPRPVVLRLSDFKTNEYKALKGGEKYEDEEDNPMIGWRGCSRYISEKYAPAFKLELKAVKKVRDEMGLKNVWIMLPFVRMVEDVTRVIALMKEEGLERGPDLKLWMMAEVPSNVILAEEFSKLVDGFSIGSNDLTQLILGADRDSELLAKLGYFDEQNPAVKKAIKTLIQVAHANNCTISICGQAPSVYTEFARFLVEEGIDSISTNADVAVKTKRIVAEEEKKIVAGKEESTGQAAQPTTVTPEPPAQQAEEKAPEQPAPQKEGFVKKIEEKVEGFFHHEKKEGE